MSFLNALKSAQAKNEIKPPKTTRSQLADIISRAENIEQGDPSSIPPEYRKHESKNDWLPRIINNLSKNRLELYWDEKPQREVLATLKSFNFWWDRDRQCWFNFNNAAVRGFLVEYFHADFGDEPVIELPEKDQERIVKEAISESSLSLEMRREAVIPETPKELPSDEKTLERYRDQVDELITHLNMRPGDLIILAIDHLHKATFSRDS